MNLKIINRRKKHKINSLKIVTKSYAIADSIFMNCKLNSFEFNFNAFSLSTELKVEFDGYVNNNFDFDFF